MPFVQANKWLLVGIDTSLCHSMKVMDTLPIDLKAIYVQKRRKHTCREDIQQNIHEINTKSAKGDIVLPLYSGSYDIIIVFGKMINGMPKVRSTITSIICTISC